MSSGRRFIFKRLRELIWENSVFEASKKDFQIPCIRNIMFNIGLTIILYFVSMLIRDTYNVEQLSVLVVAFFFTLLIFFSSYKAFFQKYAQRVFTLYLIFVIICTFELSLRYFLSQSKKEIFMGGFLLSYIVALSFTARLHWVYIATIIFVESVFISVRINTTGATQGETQMTMEIPILCFFLCLFFTQIIYSLQVSELRLFNEIQKRGKSLESFKSLMEKSLPDQIIVLPRDAFSSRRLLFSNKAAKFFFKTEVESLIISCIEGISFEGYAGVKLNFGEEEIKSVREFVETHTATNEYFTYFGRLIICPQEDDKQYNNLQTSFAEFNNSVGNPFKYNSIHLDTNQNTTYIHNHFSSVIHNHYDEEEKRKEQELLSIRLGKIEWEGEEATVLIITDITNQQKVLKLEELHTYKDQMLANVSHDMRTPLNGIIGLIQYVMDLITEPKINKTLRLAETSANSLLFMINDLLDMSQINKGKLSLNFSSFGVNELVDPVIKLIKYSMKKKNLEFFFENKVSCQAQVIADFNRFQQVLMNLLGNALKFTNKGTIKLVIYEDYLSGSPQANSQFPKREFEFSEIEAKKNDEAPYEEINLLTDLPSTKEKKNFEAPLRCVVFSVEDSGIGIKEEDLPHLFKPFGKIKSSENPNGVGLGLAISQSLAQRMAPNIKGGIQVTSKYGQGSRFWFALETIAISETQDPESVSKNEGCGAISVRDFESEFITKNRKIKKKVLCVDDDLINLLVVKNFLKPFTGIELQTARNGLEALKLIQDFQAKDSFFDLIFMDCNMPVMNGFEAAHRINDLVKLKAIPKPKMYALTGYNSEKVTQTWKSLGIKMLTKPLNRAKLIKIINSML